MPLVTSTTFNANVFKQATEPADWQNGDIWVDTDNGKPFTNNSGTAQGVGKSTALLIALG